MNRSRSAAIVRAAAPALMTVVMALAPAVARANPTPVPIDLTLGSLPEEYVRRHGPLTAMRLVSHFGDYGLEHLDSRTLAYLDAHRVTFRPLILRAMRAPHAPEDGLIEWYLVRASAAERESLIVTLRLCLTETDRENPPILRDSPTGRWPDALSCQLRAAEWLGNLGDRASVPELEKLRDWTLKDPRVAQTDDWFWPRVVVDQALARINAPGRAGFIAAGPGGRVALHCSLEQVAAMDAGKSASGTLRRLNPEEMKRYWDMILSGTFAEPRRSALDRPGLHIHFRDGLVAHLTLAESGYLDYRDNAHTAYTPSARIHAPALYEALRPLLVFHSVTAGAGGPTFLPEIVPVPDSVLDGRHPRTVTRPSHRPGRSR